MEGTPKRVSGRRAFPPSPQDADEVALRNVGAGSFPRMSASAVFVAVYAADQDTAKAKITSYSLWWYLKAAREGGVHEVSDGLEKHLVGQ